MTASLSAPSRTRIKICGLTRPQDVEAAVDAGADAIGLVFYAPSPRAVSVDQAARLARDVPAWISLVGLFVNTPQDDILRVADKVGLSHIQLHGDEQPQDYVRLGRPVVKAIRLPATPGGPAAGGSSAEQAVVSRGHLLESKKWRETAQAVLFDADSAGFGGSGHAFNWEFVSGINETLGRHWVLSGGLNLANLSRALGELSPPAIDVSSGVELVVGGQVQKGIKDPERLRMFVKAVRDFDLARTS